MAEKCLRNASCTCSMCAGFDVASLMSISKSISSNIQYEDEDGAGGASQATEDVLMDVKVEGVVISGAAPVVKTPAAEKEVKKVVQDTNMDAVATTLSNMEWSMED
ncbi:uncharacterized protein KRP23_14361 [Phytophthora ramorum]|uniref:uncharacterized protein n=1 Tax=Phytophthora ramorum TaxID=164328 RepID=UPI00309686E0|nr:hypothetical protein KRP23_14361 [Phytophthora ramorum]